MPVSVSLAEFHKDLVWVKSVPHRFLGAEVDHRMTVVRLSAGDLFVHSPARLDRQTRAEIDALGRARFFVCPGSFHDWSIEDAFVHYPGAQIYAPPGRSTGWNKLPFHGALGSAPEPEWAADLDQAVFDGGRFFREVVFLHRASRTLLVADLLVKIGRRRPGFTRLYAWVNGVYRQPRLERAIRMLILDRPAARRSIERILEWDFDRIILGHGDIVETGGRDILKSAYGWLIR